MRLMVSYCKMDCSGGMGYGRGQHPQRVVFVGCCASNCCSFFVRSSSQHPSFPIYFTKTSSMIYSACARLQAGYPGSFSRDDHPANDLGENQGSQLSPNVAQRGSHWNGCQFRRSTSQGKLVDAPRVSRQPHCSCGSNGEQLIWFGGMSGIRR